MGFEIGKEYIAKDFFFAPVYDVIYKCIRLNEEKEKVTFRVKPNGGKSYQITVPYKSWNCTSTDKAYDKYTNYEIFSSEEA